MKKIIKNFNVFVNEQREFTSPHGKETPVFTFFERIPKIGLVELSIVYSDDDIEYIEVRDPSMYSKEKLRRIEEYLEQATYDIVPEIIEVNRKRGISTSPGEWDKSLRGY